MIICLIRKQNRSGGPSRGVSKSGAGGHFFNSLSISLKLSRLIVIYIYSTSVQFKHKIVKNRGCEGGSK